MSILNVFKEGEISVVVRDAPLEGVKGVAARWVLTLSRAAERKLDAVFREPNFLRMVNIMLFPKQKKVSSKQPEKEKSVKKVKEFSA